MATELPTTPGAYRLVAALTKYPPSKSEAPESWHHDGYEFHYLNTSREWMDLGWGGPYEWDAHLLEPLVPGPRADQLF